MPKLSFLFEARTEAVVSQMMATVAIRAYIGASEMHVALKTLQLTALYRSFADASKWNLINFFDGMDRVIVQQFNRITINDQIAGHECVQRLLLDAARRPRSAGDLPAVYHPSQAPLTVYSPAFDLLWDSVMGLDGAVRYGTE